MGMNFYCRQNVCKCCGRYDELHIGKSSAGWCFALHVYPDKGINDLHDWERIFADPANTIRNEDDVALTAREMLERIGNRMQPDNSKTVPVGYESWRQFHRENGSEPGPNGMVRHQIGTGCIGHGAGTWDLIVGEFS